MSFQALLQAAAYARYQLALDSHRSLPAIFPDVTNGQISDGTPSCRQHQATTSTVKPKYRASSFKSLSASESESGCAHPSIIEMSLFQGSVTKNPKNKKLTKSNFREDQRVEMLRAEPLVGNLMPDRVWCKGCDGWVGLDKRRRYYLGMWKRHVKLYHLPGGKKYEIIQRHLQETGEKMKLFVPRRSDRHVW